MLLNNFDNHYKIKIKSYYKKGIDSSFSMAPHSHEYIEIMDIISGSCFLDIYEDLKLVKTLEIGPNSIIVISSNAFHCIRTNEETIISNLEFETALYNEISYVDTLNYLKNSNEWKKLSLEKYGITVFTDINDIANSIDHTISRIQKVGLINNDIYLDSLIFHFFIKLTEAYKNSKMLDESGTFYVNKAISLIKQHLTSDINIKDMAKALNVSLSYLERIFKKSIHMTVKKYVELLKLDLVKDNLIYSSDSIESIIKRYGYKNEAQLTYQFKRIYNMTPREYRKNHFNREIYGTDERYQAKFLKN